MLEISSRRRFRALGPLVILLVNPFACGGSGDHETAPACTGAECEAGTGGSSSPHAGLLDCPQLCRDVAACSAEVDASCGSRCESTLDMAVSLGCGPDYARYVNCVLEAADACVRVPPPECAVAYSDLDTCLCAAVPDECT